ncbi:hypothetical protein CVIRNUC_006246 [Coccomyxa viridis]|uniref:DUF2062 domain-containing protein n=1 Tax=Coccomyxa viridis TaxID=1274662 RepID=A0AAV1I8I0_9CHLO|nr:hypothetical protein CVIRNUC_006246 [Coccomyxa viridis]
MRRLYAWFKKRVTDPFWSYLKQGANPSKLSRSAAVGFSIGICPLIGISTGLCILILLVSRSLFHGPMMLLANFVALPVNVAMILPFMRLGEVILREKQLPLSPISLKDIIFNHPGDALRGVAHAILGWAVTLPFIMVGLVVLLRPIISLLQTSMHKREVDLEGGGAGAALLGEGSALGGSSACDELAMRRSSSASPGVVEGSRTGWGQVSATSLR